MVLTNEEITNVLAYIEQKIHDINRIDEALNQTQNSDVIQMKIGFDPDTTKKDNMKDIVKMIRFAIQEQGIVNIPVAFTREEVENLGVI